MSGVWIVIEVKHEFGRDLRYAMRVVLGSNDDLLDLRPENILDIEDTPVKAEYKIMSENDTLLTYKQNKSNDYVLEKSEFAKILEPIDYDNTYKNPVKAFIDNLDNSTFSLISGKNNSPFDVINPSLVNISSSIRWVRE